MRLNPPRMQNSFSLMKRKANKREKEGDRGKCPKCHGVGQWLMPGDAHKSEGMVPCGFSNQYGYCNNGKWERKK